MEQTVITYELGWPVSKVYQFSKLYTLFKLHRSMGAPVQIEDEVKQDFQRLIILLQAIEN